MSLLRSTSELYIKPLSPSFDGGPNKIPHSQNAASLLSSIGWAQYDIEWPEHGRSALFDSMGLIRYLTARTRPVCPFRYGGHNTIPNGQNAAGLPFSIE